MKVTEFGVPNDAPELRVHFRFIGSHTLTAQLALPISITHVPSPIAAFPIALSGSTSTVAYFMSVVRSSVLVSCSAREPMSF